jgi:multiple antibiotic resistance protein
LITSIIINCLIVFLVISSSDWIKIKLGQSGIVIVERVFGVILLSIGIKMFITNLVAVINYVI